MVLVFHISFFVKLKFICDPLLAGGNPDAWMLASGPWCICRIFTNVHITSVWLCFWQLFHVLYTYVLKIELVSLKWVTGKFQSLGAWYVMHLC